MNIKFATVVLISGITLAGCGGTDQPAAAPNRLLSSVASGSELLTIPHNRSNFTIARTASGYQLTDLVTGESQTVPAGVRTLEFLDLNVALDSTGTEGKAYRLYQAAFDRAPDAAGLGFWISVLSSGASLESVAAGFIDSPEFRAAYGTAPTNREIVGKFYTNVLHRAPDQAGFDFWVSVLDQNPGAAPSVLAAISESDENVERVRNAVENGIDYVASTHSPAVAALLSPNDTLRSSALDTCRWFDWSAAAPNATAQQDGLRLATAESQDVSLPSVRSQFSVRGDFRIEASVALDTGFQAAIPDSAQKYAGIGLHVDENNFVMLNVAREGGRQVIKPLRRVRGAYENPATLPFSGNATRLAISQSGATLSLSYFEDGKWISAGSVGVVGNGEYYVSIHAATIGVRQQFAARFSDFTVSAGTHTYRPYVRGPLFQRDGFMTGGVIETYPYDRYFGTNRWGSTDVLQILNSNGMNWVRTTVTTESIATLRNTPVAQWSGLPWTPGYWQSQEVAEQVIRDANARGMKASLAFFLSDTAASASRQDAPAAWRGLSVADTAARVSAHTQAVTARFKAAGLQIGLYEVGNEIEFGVLNFRPGDRIAVPPGTNVNMDFEYLRNHVWNVEAELLKAGIAGIKAADPAAKIVLHIAMTGATPGDVFVKEFFRAMKDFGVDYDIAGLSLPYPQFETRLSEYSGDCWAQRLQETSDYIARLGKQTMISEGSYSNTSTGTAALPMQGFAYSDQGQANWVREHLRFAINNKNVTGFFYFYPEWFGGRSQGDAGILALDGYGLFNADMTPRPALREFKLPARQD